MKKKIYIFKIKYFLSFICIFTLCSLIFAFSKALAQQSIPLVVAPARQTVAIDAGKSQSLQIKFFNESENTMVGTIKAINFYVSGKEGTPILLEDSPNNWIRLPYNKASIAPGEVLKVNFTVEVPADAKPGGNYAAIIFEQSGQLPGPTSSNETASQVSPRIVGLVSIRVNGPILESAFIDVLRLPNLIEFGPIPVYFEIVNKGGYHITPIGQITLTNWFGKKIDQKIIEEKNIFPDARRVYENNLGQTWMFGRYKLDLTIAYGESGKTLTTSAFVWVLPITLIVITILTIIIIVLSINLIVKKMKEKQTKLEEKLEEEISELESLKNKFKDNLPK